MASDQHAGATLSIYAQSPGGDRKRLFSGVNEQTGPAGSPDGVQATVKANELPFMPIQPFDLKGGDILVLTGTLTATDGADASDSVMNVPIQRNGRLEYLNRTDFGYTVDIPAASVIDVEHQLGAGFTVPQGDVIQLGGGTYFMSWENDTA